MVCLGVGLFHVKKVVTRGRDVIYRETECSAEGPTAAVESPRAPYPRRASAVCAPCPKLQKHKN